MAGVETESDGLAIFRAQAAMRAQDQKLRIEESIRLPTHAGVLTQAEEISRWLREQHLRSERKQPGGTMGMRGNIEQTGVRGFKHRGE